MFSKKHDESTMKKQIMEIERPIDLMQILIKKIKHSLIM